MFAAPLLAALTAFTISTKVDVPVERVYVPLVVSNGAIMDMQDDKLYLFGDKKDVTPDQIASAESLVVSAGIPRENIRSYMQTTSGIRVGVLLLDLGAPEQANDTAAAAFPKIIDKNISYSWNAYVGVDCRAMNSRIHAQLRERSQQAAAEYTGFSPGAKIRALTITTDPRTVGGAFSPIALCPQDMQPVVHSAGGRYPTGFESTFTQYVSANVAVSFDAQPAPASSAASVFPFSTFGFPMPIIGHQNRAFVLKGGRFAATPGASDIVATPDTAVVSYRFPGPASYQNAMHALQQLQIGSGDYTGDGTNLYVRLHPVTQQALARLSTLGTPQGAYRFVHDCGSLRRDARAQARERSRDLALVAARVLGVSLGGLVVDTDWAGPSTDATCGSDGTGTLADVIAFGKAHGYAYYGDPARADFWQSLYAAWTLGNTPPKIISSHIVDRLKPVILTTRAGQDVTGTATLTPDGYFYTGRNSNDFTTTVVASKSDVPKDDAPGNVIFDCEAAQERALANAIKVAQFDGPVRSFLAQPAQLLSIACLPSSTVGHTYSSMPTVYNDSSATGAATATDTITVFP